MMERDIHVKGLSELQKYLDEFPGKLQRNILRGALRSGIKPIQQQARRNVHSVSGVLAKGLKVSTRSRGATVTASLKATGKHAFVAHILEFTGAAAHLIKAKKGGAIAFAGGVYRSVMHPGLAAKPFMRPALDSQANNAVVTVANYIKQRLLTKHGIETPDVLIEGGE